MARLPVDRPSSGEWISVCSAILLLVLMYFDWFGVKSSDDSLALFSVGRNAWEALDYIPVMLLIAIIAALAEAALRLTNAGRQFAVPANAVVAILGAVSALLILFRIVYPPNFGSIGTSFGTITYEGTVQLPIFLALVAACGIAYGGYRAMREAGVPPRIHRRCVSRLV